MKHAYTAIAGAAVLALTLAGCAGGETPAPGNTDDTSAPLATVADTIYGAIEVPQPEDGELTVVALGWSDAEVALALGVVPVAVYDWQGFGADSKGVGPWATELFGDQTPTIIQNVGDALDYETIETLDPDLILNTRAAADEAVFTRLSSIAPTVYAPAGTADYGTSWDVQTAQVAQALGVADKGAEVIASVESTIDDAANAHPEFSGKTAVSGTKFGDAYGAYIAGDFRWDLLESLGFVQNPPVLDLEASGFYVPVSAEQISAFDADVATFVPIGYTLDELLADPLIASLTVVKEERTVFLESGDELTGAFSAASPLSIPIAVEGLVPLLAEKLAG
jgi:iron complex transport system substrate-binding protein